MSRRMLTWGIALGCTMVGGAPSGAAATVHSPLRVHQAQCIEYQQGEYLSGEQPLGGRVAGGRHTLDGCYGNECSRVLASTRERSRSTREWSQTSQRAPAAHCGGCACGALSLE